MNTLVLKFRDAVPQLFLNNAGVIEFGIPSVDSLNRVYGCNAARRFFHGKTKQIDWDKAPTIFVSFAETIDLGQAAADYMATGLFDRVRRNELITIDFNGANSTTFIPNDPNFIDQWSLENDSITAATNFAVTAKPDADIDMSGAWDCEQGDTSVVVAILDTGCEIAHPEFSGRIWRNWGEIAGDSIDNDANGFVDDVNGWDFHDVDNMPLDVAGHGTEMASIIGAIGNNSSQITGVDLNCKLMIARIAETSSNVSIASIIDAINYASENGANVICFTATYSTNDPDIRDAIYNAYLRELVFVCSIGNLNQYINLYPPAYHDSVGVLAVGASDAADRRWIFDQVNGSTISDNIDVCAPGENILSLDYLDHNSINVSTGTSPSTAIACGLASLLKAQDTARSADSIMSIIKSTADDEVGTALEDTPGFDIYHGHGRINAERALCLSNGLATPSLAKVRLTPYPNPTTGRVSLSLDGVRFKSCVVSVHNGLGELVLRSLTKGGQVIEIELPKTNGIYFFRADFDGKYFATGQLVKQ